MRKNKILILLILFGLLIPEIAFLEQPFKVPETLSEAKEMGKKFLEVSKKNLPGILVKIWKEEVIPFWKRIYDFFIKNIWQKIKSLFKKEIEKRKPMIKKELQKEKRELKEEIR